MNKIETFGRPPIRRATDDAQPRDLPMTEGTKLPLLTQYFRILLRWKWLILGLTLAGLILALIATLLTTPRYTATSTIEISRESDRVLEVEGVEREATTADLEFYQTQYGLLRSRSLAERVARDLRLTRDQAFLAAHDIQLDAPTGGEDRAARERRLLSEVAHALLENVGISPIRASRLVTISYTSPDPALSARIANHWGQAFIQSNLERRYEATSYARKFLEGRLEQLRQRLQESERNLVAYAGQQRIINLPGTAAGPDGTGGTPERSLEVEDLAALNARLADATADRIRAESRLATAAGSAPESLSNNGLSSLRQRRAEVAADYAKLMAQFEPDYPPAKALASQLAQLDRSIAREEGRVGTSLRGNYEEAVARERDLTARVAGLKSSLLDLRRRSIQYNIYQRDVDTNRQLYDGLLQRYKEIGVAGGVGTNNVSRVDEAEIPTRPSEPRMLVNLLIGLLAGLGVGALAALALEQIDEAITDPTDVEANLHLPLLGVIPNAGDQDVVEVLADRKSDLAEAYLSVQTNLEFATASGVPRSFSVTSTRPAEGKSSTAYALAVSLARLKRSVLLIDGDMRSPSVHHIHGIGNTRGLSNFLAGSDDLSDFIFATNQEGLSVIPSGPQPPNAAELLTGRRLEQLIDRLLERFDHVIVDSPPVMGLADAPLIASKVAGTIFAVESHGTRARLARIAIGRLSAAHSHLIGIVLTKFESRGARFGYGYGYDYGYGYGRSDSRKG